jgi:hypothetical protein
MPKMSREKCGWELTRIWLTALEETARDFYRRPKEFCTRAYENAVQNMLRIMEDEYGLRYERADSIKSAVESYIRFGVESGLFQDASQFAIEAVNPNRLEIQVLSCPYQDTCRDLLEQGLSVKELTCARLGCFRAAVLSIANIDCNYEVTGGLLEEGCQGFLERK